MAYIRSRIPDWRRGMSRTPNLGQFCLDRGERLLGLRLNLLFADDVRNPRRDGPGQSSLGSQTYDTHQCQADRDCLHDHRFNPAR